MRFLLSLCFLHWLAMASWADEQVDFFERKIRPVLVEHCYACHSAEGTGVEGGLRVDSRDAMRRGGESGPAILPGVTEKSLLISAIKYETLEMPPDRKLSDEVVADFIAWIEKGAADPRDESILPQEEVKSQIDYESGRKFWSFQKPQRHALPAHAYQAWCRMDADHFVAEKLELAGLSPSPQADSATLLRRLAFDLTGLPPSLELTSQAPKIADVEAISAVVDQLLASTAFGEHWARMWLDVMRFADDQAHIVGNNKSLFFPNSYMYRDWVIQALNHDMPYREFIELQLAADLLTPEDSTDDVALGFIGLGPKYYRRSSPEVMADELEDRVDVLSRGLLGLTVACARCHDHKYDPIGTADYYALAGIFASIDMFNRPLDGQVEKDDKGEAKDPEGALHIVREHAEPTDLTIMVRGDVNRRGPVVPRRFLTVLCSSESQPFGSTNSGRLELAQAIASAENPLTARVFVNRVWARLMGQPLVDTPSNFGQLGGNPSHPELLDDLAVRFMENNWSLKWLCREIVMSATYQQSSQATLDGTAINQSNRLLWRMNRKRLTVEQWRDSLLTAAGRLDSTIGGGSHDPSDSASNRRTLYSEVSRLNLNPLLALFDFPDPNAHSERRSQSTSPSQKLFLINSPFMVDTSRALASQLQYDAEKPQTLIVEAYRRLFSREPSSSEMELSLQFLADGQRQQVERYVHGLMVTSETLFVN